MHSKLNKWIDHMKDARVKDRPYPTKTSPNSPSGNAIHGYRDNSRPKVCVPRVNGVSPRVAKAWSWTTRPFPTGWVTAEEEGVPMAVGLY